MSKSIFRTKYRVVKDNYLGYEAQFKPWWLPYYEQLDSSNTHSTLEKAKKFIDNNKNLVVYSE